VEGKTNDSELVDSNHFRIYRYKFLFRRNFIRQSQHLITAGELFTLGLFGQNLATALVIWKVTGIRIYII
jgi:hypothetical protein